MGKALTIQRTTVPAGERGKYFERLAACSSHYKAANCRFWVYEESALPGAFIEFTEADDVTTLVQALLAGTRRGKDKALIGRLTVRGLMVKPGYLVYRARHGVQRVDHHR